jgi:hypothetical protein
MMRGIPIAAMLGLLAFPACAPVLGYPDNFGDQQSTVSNLETTIAAQKALYYSPQTTDLATRRRLRDSVVYNEMQIYEIYYSRFNQRLWGDTNVVSAGGDLIVLALAGLGATTGSTATKSALAAASAGVVGAQAAISKDLYYQRTLPALLAQISANRDTTKAGIYDALSKQDDTTYPLARAEIDLQALQRESGIADAIQNITEQATIAKINAEAAMNAARSGTYSTTSSSDRLRAWLEPNGAVDTAHRDALQNWINTQRIDPTLPSGVPFAQFLTDPPGLNWETDRQKAISDLKIP